MDGFDEPLDQIMASRKSLKESQTPYGLKSMNTLEVPKRTTLAAVASSHNYDYLNQSLNNFNRASTLEPFRSINEDSPDKNEKIEKFVKINEMFSKRFDKSSEPKTNFKQSSRSVLSKF